ncbi:MAG: anti-sigma factor domain-containing protein [Candidatus Limnocylindrales bacterium]
MTHAEVRARLADALLTPAAGGLDPALAGDDREAIALRDHLAGCAACTAELDALRATAVLLALGAPDSMRTSAATRSNVLAAAGAAASAGRSGAISPQRPSPRHLPRTSVRAAVAAVLVLAAALGGVLGGLALSGQRDSAQSQLAQLRALSAASEALLADPGAVRLTLAGSAGQGSVALSRTSGKLVVIATGLPALPAGQRYDCYLERAGARTWVGFMESSDGVAWWTGAMSWVADPGQPGDSFLVLIGSEGAPVLSGRF